MKIDPKLDLKIERVVDVPPELVWMAWTQPKHLMPWFCPRPWKTVECEIDLRPGGIFQTTMESPDGDRFPGTGCYLEVIPERKLVWTSILEPGFRPKPLPPADTKPEEAELHFTGIILLEPHGNGGTRYTAIALHADESTNQRHRDMGFEQGWGTCLDQLVDYVKSVR